MGLLEKEGSRDIRVQEGKPGLRGAGLALPGRGLGATGVGLWPRAPWASAPSGATELPPCPPAESSPAPPSTVLEE